LAIEIADIEIDANTIGRFNVNLNDKMYRHNSLNITYLGIVDNKYK